MIKTLFFNKIFIFRTFEVYLRYIIFIKMIVYNKYLNSQDHTWFDSSNVIYSKCYDNTLQTKTLKIVFKNGRTYRYKDVDIHDYIQFKNAKSNGSAVNTYIIKKYSGVRIADTEVDKLDELKKTFIDEDTNNGETKFSNLAYHIDFCDKTGEFVLKLNNRIVYSGIEGNVSIINLLKSLNINYSWEQVESITNDNDEKEDKIILN